MTPVAAFGGEQGLPPRALQRGTRLGAPTIPHEIVGSDGELVRLGGCPPHTPARILAKDKQGASGGHTLRERLGGVPAPAEFSKDGEGAQGWAWSPGALRGS